MLFDGPYQQAAMMMSALFSPKTRYWYQTSQSGVKNSISVSERVCRRNISSSAYWSRFRNISSQRYSKASFDKRFKWWNMTTNRLSRLFCGRKACEYFRQTCWYFGISCQADFYCRNSWRTDTSAIACSVANNPHAPNHRESTSFRVFLWDCRNKSRRSLNWYCFASSSKTWVNDD